MILSLPMFRQLRVHLRGEGAAVERELGEVSADVDRTEAQLAAVLVELRAINARLDAMERSSRPT